MQLIPKLYENELGGDYLRRQGTWLFLVSIGLFAMNAVWFYFIGALWQHAQAGLFSYFFYFMTILLPVTLAFCFVSAVGDWVKSVAEPHTPASRYVEALIFSALVTAAIASTLGFLYLTISGFYLGEVRLPGRAIAVMITVHDNPLAFWFSEAFWSYCAIRIIAASFGRFPLIYAKVTGIPDEK
jgi:hypothetical protein